MNTQKNRKKSRNWKQIVVPKDLFEIIDSEANARKCARWKVIAEAFSLYKSFQKSRERQRIIQQNGDLIEKVSWYVLKLSKSLGAFHENPTSLNYSYFMERLDEIESRILPQLSQNVEDIRIILKRLRELAKQYLETKGKNTKIEMNDLTKTLIKLLFISL